jgi:AhpD family alkylhydroperoxidase
MKFKKRKYRNPKDFFSDLAFLIRNSNRYREIFGRKLISPAFREKLMLAVTAVNGCRYCSYFHARQALKTGITSQEINLLLAGEIADCSEYESVAMLYAQHWAETDAHPDPEAIGKLQEVYGPEKAEAIQLVLRMIRLGNLSGNSCDYLIYRPSCGRWRG